MKKDWNWEKPVPRDNCYFTGSLYKPSIISLLECSSSSKILESLIKDFLTLYYIILLIDNEFLRVGTVF